MEGGFLRYNYSVHESFYIFKSDGLTVKLIIAAWQLCGDRPAYAHIFGCLPTGKFIVVYLCVCMYMYICMYDELI